MARVPQDGFETRCLFEERAEELRAIASGLTEDSERNLLLLLAAECDVRAKAVERRARYSAGRQLLRSVRLVPRPASHQVE